MAIGYGWNKSLQIDQSGNVTIPGITTIRGNVGGIGIDLVNAALIRGMQGKVGLRAYSSTVKYRNTTNIVPHLGQINIANNFDDFSTTNQWGAQMSGYDGDAEKYSSLRVSYKGLEYKSSTDKTVFNMNNKITLEYNNSTESLDFKFN